jgi:hypothetical protein
MRTNQSTVIGKTTHEGAPAPNLTIEQQLRRTIMCCLLWEDTFYESGESIANRIQSLGSKLPFATVAAIAREAKVKLRHAPMYLALATLGRNEGAKVGDLFLDMITRADEIAELLAMYWRGGKKPLPKQLRRALQLAFYKFNEYQFAKYDRDAPLKLRDVMFLVHPKPRNEEEKALFSRIAERKLTVPDTWEVALSGGANKTETFQRLITENKLGDLAFLRNLRNMKEVPRQLILDSFAKRSFDKVLPFRFIAAANAAPEYEPQLEAAMLRALDTQSKLEGRTILFVDNSGSMDSPISAKSDLRRTDAAQALAMLLREICTDLTVYSFSNDATLVPARRGFGLREAIRKTPSGGTYLGQSLQIIRKEKYDRLIIITDEQSATPIPALKGYILNVAGYENSINFGSYVQINGWSESVIDFIREYEKS